MANPAATTTDPAAPNTRLRRYGLTAAAALFPIIVRLALLPWYPPPLPAFHDEFSYLLAADTFASGRLTNATHPFWQHFETFHVIHTPSYASKYPPAQGLFLAFGQICGHPWIGVLLSVALMTGAICWMLQGWVRPWFAFAGALLVGFRIGVISYWANSYWGGAVAAFGGALLVGALPRLLDASALPPRKRHVLAFAAGLIVLANSRPYEGLVLAVGVTAVLLVALFRKPGGLAAFCRHIALPALPLLAAAALWMAYYNHRVTGDWRTLPYQVHERQYGSASAFLWSPPHSLPEYRHPQMAKYWVDYELMEFQRAKSNPLDNLLVTLFVCSWFFLGSRVIGLFFVGAPQYQSSSRQDSTWPALVFFVLGLLPVKAVLPHYVAPACGLGFLRLMTLIETLWRSQTRRELVNSASSNVAERFGLGLFLRRGLVCAVLGWILTQGLREPVVQPLQQSPFGSDRENVVRSLQNAPGQHLVMVEYTPQSDPHREWVYNRAGIDESKVIWARSMGATKDASLVAAYPGRNVWILRVSPRDFALSRVQ